MFRKILVPVDFTEKNEAAIQAALEVIGSNEEAEIYLVHVIETIEHVERAEAIVAYAEERGMDLIVLSSHKVDRDHPALGWGTISYRIAIVARCPVLLVK